VFNGAQSDFFDEWISHFDEVYSHFRQRFCDRDGVVKVVQVECDLE